MVREQHREIFGGAVTPRAIATESAMMPDYTSIESEYENRRRQALRAMMITMPPHAAAPLRRAIYALSAAGAAYSCLMLMPLLRQRRCCYSAAAP